MNKRRPLTGYPFFPLKVKRDQEGMSVFNPVELTEHEINSDAGGLLAFCNGRNSFDEIITTISRDTGLEGKDVRAVAEEVLSELTDMGMIWWRKRQVIRQPAPIPQGVFWDITLECNLRCAHCVVAAGQRQPGELSTAECKRLLDELHHAGVPVVTFSGGEPLCRQDFFEIANYAHTKGMEVAISTNGTLIDKEIAKELTRLGMDIQVSLDGSTAALHDRFRGRPGAFQATLKGIEHLREAGADFTLGSVFNRLNLHDIGNLLDFSIALGAQAFRLIPFIPAGRGREFQDLEPSPQDLKQITEYLRGRRPESPITITPLEFEFTFTPGSCVKVSSTQQHGCDGARSSFSISATGEVLPCSFFSGVRAENVRDYPFAWIWNNSSFLNYFRDLRADDIEGVCQSCPWFGDCLGGCPSANFSQGEMLRPNARCWVAKEICLQ